MYNFLVQKCSYTSTSNLIRARIESIPFSIHNIKSCPSGVENGRRVAVVRVWNYGMEAAVVWRQRGALGAALVTGPFYAPHYIYMYNIVVLWNGTGSTKIQARFYLHAYLSTLCRRQRCAIPVQTYTVPNTASIATQTIYMYMYFSIYM